jgi:hypothetical protein
MTEPFRLQNEDASMPVAEFSEDLTTVKLQGFIIGHLSGLPVTTARSDLNGERFMLRLLWKFLVLLVLIKRLPITWYFIGLIYKGLAASALLLVFARRSSWICCMYGDRSRSPLILRGNAKDWSLLELAI